MSGRYLLFAWNDYYPNGGIDDLVGRFDSMEEARAGFVAEIGRTDAEKWADTTGQSGQIVDAETFEVVESLSGQDGDLRGPDVFVVTIQKAGEMPRAFVDGDKVDIKTGEVIGLGFGVYR